MTDNQFVALMGVVVVAAVIGGAVIARTVLRLRRRRRLLAMPTPPEWREIFSRNVPFYDHMPPDVTDRLGGLVRVFLAEKRFEGCGGLEVTNEMRVTIAAQACLLVVGRPGEFFPRCPVILLYPTAYFVPELRGPFGDYGREVRLGESWGRDGIVLAWNHVRRTAVAPGKGSLVAHEFSHQLDGDDGAVDGLPVLPDWSACLTWQRVLNRELQALDASLAAGKSTVLGKYAASSEAEFFAEAVSAFFTRPGALKAESPDLYGQLAGYFKLDPVTWEKRDSGEPVEAGNV